ncbi:transposase [Erysipelotrichaceae bacterium]|nr:transposase [Erysipelotrichaceae bacterium]
MARKARRTFTKEYKLQMVQLYENGKRRVDICKEYELTPSSLDKWITQYQKNQSFKESDNLTADEKKIREQQKIIKQQELEIDILKQAARDKWDENQSHKREHWKIFNCYNV